MAFFFGHGRPYAVKHMDVRERRISMDGVVGNYVPDNSQVPASMQAMLRAHGCAGAASNMDGV